MDSASLDDVTFLTRSEHRIGILDAVSEKPRGRHELREITGASRVTVNRILDDLEARGWIVRQDGRCEATPKGAFVADEVTGLISNLTVSEKLEDALQWMPTDAFDFDLSHLADAEVFRKSDWEDHTETIRRITDLVNRSSRIRGTAVGFSHEVVNAIREATTENDISFEVVVEQSTLDMIRGDAGLRTRFQEILESQNTAMARYEGQPPLHMVMVLDQTVMVCGTPSGGGPRQGWVRTNNDTVRTWAVGYFESALDDSTRITPDAFLGEPRETA